MKKVLHVVHIMSIGGIENFIMNVYRNIDRDKIQFDFAVCLDEKGTYDDEIKKLGGKIIHISQRRKDGILYYKKWKNFLKMHSFEYDAIHMHVSSLTTIAPLVYAKKYGIKNRIVHAHSTLQIGIMHSLFSFFNKRRIKKYATTFFACSTEAGKYVFGNNINFKLIKNGIDLDKFKYDTFLREKIRKELDIKKDDIAYVHVGRFCYAKNHKFLIDVFNYICKENNNSKLFLIGSGELMDEIKNMVISLKLESKVIFLGNRTDISSLLNAMDCMIFPSNYEGLPVTLIEAQTSGIFIYASNRISNEVKITDSIDLLPLELGTKKWANIITSKKYNHNIDNILDVKKSGFDIKDTVKELYKTYIK